MYAGCYVYDTNYPYHAIRYTGDNTEDTFNLSYTPISVNEIMVFVDGVPATVLDGEGQVAGVVGPVLQHVVRPGGPPVGSRTPPNPGDSNGNPARAREDRTETGHRQLALT